MIGVWWGGGAVRSGVSISGACVDVCPLPVSVPRNPPPPFIHCLFLSSPLPSPPPSPPSSSPPFPPPPPPPSGHTHHASLAVPHRQLLDAVAALPSTPPPGTVQAGPSPPPSALGGLLVQLDDVAQRASRWSGRVSVFMSRMVSLHDEWRTIDQRIEDQVRGGLTHNQHLKGHTLA